MPSQGLSERERRFVDAYMGAACGNAAKAAVLAGYSAKSARRIGTRLSTRVHIQSAIGDRQKTLTNASIADGTERREFLTGLLRSPQVDARDRLKACDQLNRLSGEYSERREHSGAVAVIASAADERL